MSIYVEMVAEGIQGQDEMYRRRKRKNVKINVQTVTRSKQWKDGPCDGACL